MCIGSLNCPLRLLIYFAGLCPAPHKLLKKFDKTFLILCLPRRDKNKRHGATAPRPNMILFLVVAH